MILEKGDMWSVFGKTGLFMITTNPIKRKDGAIVMGRGIAKQAAERFPTLPYDFGYRYSEHFAGYQGLTPTGLVKEYDGQTIGYFMVKRHWRLPAEILIIEDSVLDLCEYAHSFRRVDLNFPGIGNGKLAREDVLPLLQVLPDNVHIWEFEQ